MTTKQFIEKAIEGGWNNEYVIDYYLEEKERQSHLLLNPKAWQAVGKVNRWNRGTPKVFRKYWLKKTNIEMKGSHEAIPFWHYQWLRMIDALAEGKSIEEFLKTL